MGFSVQEYDPYQQTYLVRTRHAHAWALAYVDGKWVDLDTTPPDWGQLEAAQQPFWQSLSDFFSRLWFTFQQWRHSRSAGASGWLTLLIPPLLLYLLWRIFKRLAKKGGRRVGQNNRGAQQGIDSPFFRIESLLNERTSPRKTGDPLQQWLSRVGHDELQPLRLLHDRYRFHPDGLLPEEEERLHHGVVQWLAEQGARGKQ